MALDSMRARLSALAAWWAKTWGRWATLVAVTLSAALVFLAPGGWVFVVDLAYNVVRAFAALVMFEALLQYSTRKILEGVAKITPEAREWRFATLFMRIAENPLALSIFLAAGMGARAVIVWAVWK